jgi:hypothetical protein
MEDISNNDTSIKIEPVIKKQKLESDKEPYCEYILNKMFWITILPVIQYKSKFRYIVPILVNIILGSASFCMLYYPSYYPTQGEVWTSDIVIAWFTYNYMIYLFTRWDKAKCYESINVSNTVNRISMLFYWLYIVYWFYFAIIQFSTHNEPSILIQLGNILMSTAWLFFFTTMSVLYYFICIKLSQRSNKINEWLKDLKEIRPQLNDFYNQYNSHYRNIKELAKYWNILIFVGSLLLTFHVPIDLISIIYKQYYYDIFGLVVKITSLLWYLWRICELNDNEQYIISYLYKHRIYEISDIEGIEKYVVYRPLGLNFYGIKINKAFIIKIGLITINLIIPTIYALVSNRILK